MFESGLPPDLLEALETIRRDLRPELLVIEGSGLASPYPFAGGT